MGRPGKGDRSQDGDQARILTLTEDGYPDTEEGLRYMLECSAHWGELLALIKFYLEYGITYRSPSTEAETDS